MGSSVAARLSLFVVVVSVLVSLCFAEPRSATCFLRPDPKSTQQVEGLVTFKQDSATSQIVISVEASGFNILQPDQEKRHGFHVHAKGDISGGCISTSGHYNPDNEHHGAPDDQIRHAGDFGNLNQSDDGKMTVTFTDPKATLYGDKSIVGRAIVVHAGVDDLGRGGNDASLANGNAGPRLACCVIGWATGN